MRFNITAEQQFLCSLLTESEPEHEPEFLAASESFLPVRSDHCGQHDTDNSLSPLGAKYTLAYIRQSRKTAYYFAYRKKVAHAAERRIPSREKNDLLPAACQATRP